MINATAMLCICAEEQLLLINHLQTPDVHFPSKNTSRKKREWTSELYTCIVFNQIEGLIKFFLLDVIYIDSNCYC